jgi:igA1 protease
MVKQMDYGVNMFLAKALENRGLTTYSHELTHLFDRTVILNNSGRRDGIGGEFYARGIYETYEAVNESILNLNLIFNEKGKDGYRNTDPSRFVKEEDLRKYMGGVFDVLYTLDYLEAKEVLNKDTNTKKEYFNKIEQKEDGRSVDTGKHTIDVFKNIDVNLANNLHTIRDLINNDLVVSRYAFQGISTIGEARTNGYYVIDMFRPIFAGIQNDNGASRRYNNEKNII